MALVSIWFRSNTRLQECLTSDSAHVQKGDQGYHVALIQSAILMLDNTEISADEQNQSLYGRSRMTIQSLDNEMLARERRALHLLLGFGVSPPRMAIVSEISDWGVWASQVKAAHSPNVVVLPVPGSSTAEANVKVIKQAIGLANGGLLILNIGHGVCLNQDEGAFDLGPAKVMRITGKHSDRDVDRFVTAFYDTRPPTAIGAIAQSDKENDEKNPTPGGKERLRRWAIYQDLCTAFATGSASGVLLLTCRIGGATGFLKKIAAQWQRPIFAYTDQAMAVPRQNGRVRVILAKDKGRENQFPTTNTPFGEIFFPLSATDMVQIRP
jgi:hypothetical protein